MQSIKMFEIVDGNLRNKIKLLPSSLSKINDTFLHRMLALLSLTVTIKALFLLKFLHVLPKAGVQN